MDKKKAFKKVIKILKTDKDIIDAVFIDNYKNAYVAVIEIDEYGMVLYSSHGEIDNVIRNRYSHLLTIVEGVERSVSDPSIEEQELSIRKHKEHSDITDFFVINKHILDMTDKDFEVWMKLN